MCIKVTIKNPFLYLVPGSGFMLTVLSQIVSNKKRILCSSIAKDSLIYTK
jgi:hypothetical protein